MTNDPTPTYGVTAMCTPPDDMGTLTLDEYQRRAMTTCMESCRNVSYMFLNLIGEAGEFASKIAKSIRRGQTSIQHNGLVTTMDDQELADLRKEAGDMLRQLSGLCTVMGWPLSEVAAENLVKLADRKQRGVISADGDNR